MSTFTRTNSGLTNLNLFHSVDLVVFTEGGSKSLSVDEVANKEENRAIKDTRFWSLVLNKNGIANSYKIKAVGSKISVLNLAAKIKAGEVSNIAVAMDRDLDDFFEGTLSSPFILYTQGYSWEADVFTKELTKEQIASVV